MLIASLLWIDASASRRAIAPAKTSPTSWTPCTSSSVHVRSLRIMNTARNPRVRPLTDSGTARRDWTAGCLERAAIHAGLGREVVQAGHADNAALPDLRRAEQQVVTELIGSGVGLGKQPDLGPVEAEGAQDLHKPTVQLGVDPCRWSVDEIGGDVTDHALEAQTPVEGPLNPAPPAVGDDQSNQQHGLDGHDQGAGPPPSTCEGVEQQ